MNSSDLTYKIHNDFDAGALSWVITEIRDALLRSKTALHDAPGQSEEAQFTLLKHAKTYLHQAQGAMQMVDVDGVVMLTEVIEDLLDRMADRRLAIEDQYIRPIENALLAIPEYLDDLMVGSNGQQSVRLFHYYKALQEMNGAEHTHPAEMFYLDLSTPKGMNLAYPVSASTPAGTPDYVLIRQYFERALLLFLKSQDQNVLKESARKMQGLISEVWRDQHTAQTSALWAILYGFAELVSHQNMFGDSYVKQVFGRINLQIRRFSEGAVHIPERLARDALFFIARSDQLSPCAAAVFKAYHLKGKVPVGFEQPQFGKIEFSVLAGSKEKLVQIKNLWGKIAGGDTNSFEQFEQMMKALAEIGIKLNSPPLSKLLRELTGITRHALQGKMQQDFLMAVAASLLFIESALEQIAHLPADFSERADIISARLLMLASGEEPEKSAPWLDEMSREAQQRQMMVVLVDEMKASLRLVEKTLDDYFRSPENLSDLKKIDPVLHQIGGALSMLEQDDASRALKYTQSLVSQITKEEHPIDVAASRDLKKIAQNIGTLSFYIDALQFQPDAVKTKFSFDETTGLFISHLPGDSVMENAHGQGNLPDLPPSEGVGPPGSPVKNGAEPRANSPDSPVIQPIGDDDAELMSVFLAEAKDVLMCIHDTLPLSRSDPSSQELLVILRRSFHTLKGSGRMVGLTAFGDAAWSIEQVMNFCLSDVRPGNDDLYSLLEHAEEVFTIWVTQLSTTGQSDCAGDALIQEAAGQLRIMGVQTDVRLPDVILPGPDDKKKENKLAFFTLPEPLPLSEENSKNIGGLKIDSRLHAIYLLETDEIIRLLVRDFSEWRHEPYRPVSQHAIHAIHSLAGSSSTIGFASMQEVAQALELVLQRLERYPVQLLPGEFGTLDNCIECVKQMLHYFAIAEMVPHKPEQVMVLQQLLSMLADRFYSQNTGANADADTVSVHTDRTPVMPDDVDSGLVTIFLEEGNDLFFEIGEILRAWQANPGDVSPGQSILRLLHTLKGSARMVNALELGQHIHDMESQVDDILNAGQLSVSAGDDLLDRYDRAMVLFEAVHNRQSGDGLSAGQTVSADVADAVNFIHTAQLPAPVNLPESALQNNRDVMQIVPQQSAGTPGWTLASTLSAPLTAPLVRVRADVLDRLVNQAGEVSISRTRLEDEVATLRSSLSELNDNVTRLRSQLREVEIQAEAQISSRMTLSGDRDFDPLEFDRFTRLQELTRMMAESVDDVSTVQSSLVRTVGSADRNLHLQTRFTRDLQQDLMRLRMVPFSSISERLYRVTRQVAEELDKRVNLVIHGSSVEMDRSVLEKMVAPFEHLLRNAIVHGIESAGRRKALGKEDAGEIRLEVRQEGNEVVILFIDDGQGLDLAGISSKAEQRGLLQANQVIREAEVLDLIFAPGFSTAAEVTELAGRGVGMDVVRSEVTALGGRIVVTSIAGAGATFTINLPLTLAVAQVVLLKTGNKTYALPSVLVEQVQQIRAAELLAAYNEGATLWRGQRIPLIYLSALLADYTAEPVSQHVSSIIIMKSGNDRVAFHVDEVIGNREVVVKNIGPQLARLSGISGATILGSGDIILILNPLPLALKVLSGAPQLPRLPDGGAEEDSLPAASLRPGAIMENQSGASQFVQGLRRKPGVMVVDDSLTVRKVTQRLLIREGYQVRLAKDGVDALEQLQEFTPDVMLVDIEMPRMDGFGLVRSVRNSELTRAIPIIMITSRTADKHRNYAMELGANAYLGKPYQEDELLKTISEFISSPCPPETL